MEVAWDVRNGDTIAVTVEQDSGAPKVLAAVLLSLEVRKAKDSASRYQPPPEPEPGP